LKAYLRVSFFVWGLFVLIKINGAESEIADGLSVRDLLNERKMPGKAIIIELNGELVKRESWDSLKLNSGDHLEIIGIIGGG
jgi:thiamine biosynthesis protein ThiS